MAVICSKQLKVPNRLTTFYLKPNPSDPDVARTDEFTLYAKEGMTFSEWCNSEYNTIGAYTQVNTVYLDVSHELENVTPDTVIAEDAIYYYKFD